MNEYWRIIELMVWQEKKDEEIVDALTKFLGYKKDMPSCELNRALNNIGAVQHLYFNYKREFLI